jgi:hypothetical protein
MRYFSGPGDREGPMTVIPESKRTGDSPMRRKRSEPGFQGVEFLR